MRWIVPFALSLSVSACQCGGISEDDFPSQAAKTVCTKVYECCNSGEVNGTSFGPDQPTCETNVKASFNQTGAIKDGEKKGRIEYHSDLAEECLAQYKALSCEQLKSNATTVTPACDSYLVPKVSTGASCGFDKECIGGTCAGEGNGVDGTCQPFVAENGDCSDGGVCGKDLYCASTCKRLKADGESCGTNFECATGGCNGRDPDAGTAGTCGPKGGEGTTCYATTGCSSVPAGFVLFAGILALVALLRAGRRRNASTDERSMR